MEKRRRLSESLKLSRRRDKRRALTDKGNSALCFTAPNICKGKLMMQSFKVKARVNQNGQLIINSGLPPGKVEVIVLYPAEPDMLSDCWESLKKQIEAKYPEVKRMNNKERVKLFEQLSQKAAEKLPFQTLEEAEKFMRRQDYDFS